MSYRCQVKVVDAAEYSSHLCLFWFFCLDVLSIAKREAVKSPAITVDFSVTQLTSVKHGFMDFETLSLGTYSFVIVFVFLTDWSFYRYEVGFFFCHWSYLFVLKSTLSDNPTFLYLLFVWSFVLNLFTFYLSVSLYLVC